MKDLVARKQRTRLVKRLREKENPALGRLARAVEANESHKDTVNYSRMHHRHNRD